MQKTIATKKINASKQKIALPQIWIPVSSRIFLDLSIKFIADRAKRRHFRKFLPEIALGTEVTRVGGEVF